MHRLLNQRRTSSQATALWVAALLCLVFVGSARAALTHETETEFFASVDVNGDGRLDVVVLDRPTGNVRVGYQDATGALSWSSPLPTRVPNATGFTTGRFLASDREAIAVTSPELNRVHVVDLTDATSAASPLIFSPASAGPSLVVGLRAPQGTVLSKDVLWVCSNTHDPGQTILETFEFSILGPTSYLTSVGHPGYLVSGNSLTFPSNVTTFAAAMSRGSNDTFRAHAFTNGISVFLARSNLPAGTEYSFGRFNNEAHPRFLFYVPGTSNIIVQSLTVVSGAVQFGPATVNVFTSAVQRIFYLDEGTNGLAVVQFGNGVAGMRLPAGSDTLQEQYRFGTGANLASGVLSLSSNRFVLLSQSAGTSLSITGQVYARSGNTYTQTGSTALPQVTSNRTRANVWLFATEPFVNPNPLFVSSVNGGDWITSLTGLPGSLTATAETDRGTVSGLGNPTNQLLSTPPNTVQFGIANQYHPGISLFSYSSVRAPEPVLVSISPPPGHYESGINIAITTSNASDVVRYRIGSAGLFQQYSAPFGLSSNSTVHYYGVASSGQRSSIQSASYTFTDNSPPPLVTTNGTGTNNIPPGGTINTSGVPTYVYGTVVYSRLTGTNGTIWMVNLDGTSDRYITVGSRPRLSPDGRYLAFLREGDPYATIPHNNGNIWVRDLRDGLEWRLITHTNLIFWFDWGYQTNLFFDHGCRLFVTDLAGNVTPLGAGMHCNDDAPAVNPIDGTLAFHNASGVSDTNSGLFITDSTFSQKWRLTNAPVPHYPSWSPDGERIAFASYSYTYIPEGGMDLFIAEMGHDGHEHYHEITAFEHGSGFRHGAVWSPAGDALIGAGNVFGTNGIWIVPLSEDGTHCEGTPWMIPITPGSDFGVDFVGTVYVPPGPPRVFIRRGVGSNSVYWRRTAWPYVLEVTSALGPSAVWTPVAPPYSVANGNNEVTVPLGPGGGSYFRLRLP